MRLQDQYILDGPSIVAVGFDPKKKTLYDPKQKEEGVQQHERC
jgi:hypothetical protein